MEDRVRLEFKSPAVPFLELHKSRDTGNSSLSVNGEQWPPSDTSGSRTGPAAGSYSTVTQVALTGHGEAFVGCDFNQTKKEKGVTKPRTALR